MALFGGGESKAAQALQVAAMHVRALPCYRCFLADRLKQNITCTQSLRGTRRQDSILVAYCAKIHFASVFQPGVCSAH